MLRPLVLFATSATLALAPVAAQAAPARAPASVSGQSEELTGLPTEAVVFGAIVFALIIYLAITSHDDDDDFDFPTSP